MKTIKYNPPKFLVLKHEDIKKHLDPEQRETLEDIVDHIHGRRMVENKNKWPNMYLVLNIDETYAQQVWDIMRAHGHTPCHDCHKSQKEMFCKPNGCRWHALFASANNTGLKPGDQVIMVNCYEAGLDKYKDKVFTVQSEPWDLCGSEVVKLDGIAGGFATEFLQKV